MQEAPPYIVPDSGDDTFKWLQDVNTRNEIDQLDLDLDGPTEQIQTQYDAAGNLTFDGTYFYQYDAWNRLVQINEASWNTGTSSVDIGLIVKHYTYDGHGRLIRIQSPYPDPWATQGGDFRTERIYYDGIRRIQEVIVDPVTGESGGGEEAEGEDDQIGGGQAVEYLSREYVWGPGDQGFDELLVQYNGLGDEFWAIMDAGGDLVALCDLGGSGGAARVVGQWTYDAYGAVLSADHLHAMAHPHLGHKGLFVDRLDAGIVTDIGGPESPRLVPFAHAVYQNRNRAYSPALGRFFQRDPNATAATLLSMSSTGRGFAALSIAFSMDDLYGDGANLYEYLGSNPWNRSDPLGLSWDPFSIVDEYLAESAGSRAAFLTQVGQHATAVAVVAATIASYLPFPVLGNVGEAALYALGERSDAEFATAMALGLIPGGKLGAAVGQFFGKISSSAWSAATHYARNYGSPAIKAVGGFLVNGARGALDLASRALRKLTRCGCFVGPTVVWTADGPIPIEDVRVGDLVVTRDEETGIEFFQEVIDKIVTPGTALVEIDIHHNSGRVERIRTTDEHPFFSNGTWVRADGLQVGAKISTLSGSARVRVVRFPPVRETVYNLTVAGTASYFAGDSAAWVHNCPSAMVIESRSYNEAVGKALAELRMRGYEPSVPWTARKSPGGPNGMQTPDKKAGYRIDFDHNGAHINIKYPKQGQNRPHFRFPGNRRAYLSILRQLFGRR